MSYISIVLTSVFSANVLLVYGFGVCPAFRRQGGSSAFSAIGLLLANLLCSGLFWALKVLALAPLHLEFVEPIAYAVVVLPLVVYFAHFLISFQLLPLISIGSTIENLAPSCLVFGIALTISRAGYSLPEALLASVASAFGYWAAIVLLDAIREHLELSNLPESFKGRPAMLLSAGLMAMAFMAFDSAFIKAIAG